MGTRYDSLKTEPQHAYGFQTSGGSIYIFDPQGRTKRFKVSPGRNQGNWDVPAHCLFIAPREPLDVYGPGEKLYLVYEGRDGKPERLPFNDTVTMPRPAEMKKAGVLVQDAATGNSLASLMLI